MRGRGGPHIPKIQEDAERLDQALENLLKHAIVSGPEGEKFYLTVGRAGEHLYNLGRPYFH